MFFFFFNGEESQRAQPINLYLDIEPGQVADIEVVARAALAFSKTIKEVVFVLDPSLEIRVEIASGTPGSLSRREPSIISAPPSRVTLEEVSLACQSRLAAHRAKCAFRREFSR